jgi:hypothetical protein
MATHIFTDGRPYQPPFRNSKSIFIRVASSILMSSGQAFETFAGNFLRRVVVHGV